MHIIMFSLKKNLKKKYLKKLLKMLIYNKHRYLYHFFYYLCKNNILKYLMNNVLQ